MILLFIAGIVAYVLWVNIYMIYITMTVPKKSIKEIYDEAKTGDIILFKQKYMSHVFNHLTNFTHAALVIMCPITKEKYVVESMQNINDKIQSYDSYGIQLNSLYNKLYDYEGNMFHLKIRKNIDDTLVIKFLKDLPFFMKDVPFNLNFSNFIFNKCSVKRLCPSCLKYNDTYKKLVCSEFVGFALKELGVVNYSFDHHCLFPADFINIREDDERLYYDMSYIIKKNI